MRITNGMLVNNTLTNINRNKTKMDTLNSQLTTEKKIQRPSEDPIVAIRALRFRSTLSEIGVVIYDIRIMATNAIAQNCLIFFIRNPFITVVIISSIIVFMRFFN